MSFDSQFFSTMGQGLADAPLPPVVPTMPTVPSVPSVPTAPTVPPGPSAPLPTYHIPPEPPTAPTPTADHMLEELAVLERTVLRAVNLVTGRMALGLAHPSERQFVRDMVNTLSAAATAMGAMADLEDRRPVCNHTSYVSASLSNPSHRRA